MRLPHLSSLKRRLALHTVLPCLVIAGISWVLFAGHYRSYRHLVRVRNLVDLSNRFSEIGEQLQAESNASMFTLLFARATHDEAMVPQYERNYRAAIRRTDAMLADAQALWQRIDKQDLDPITRQRIDEGFQRATEIGAWRKVALSGGADLPAFVTEDPYYQARLREHRINLAASPALIQPQAVWDLLKDRDYGGLTDYFGDMMLYAARVSEDAGLARRILLQAQLLRFQTLADREDGLVYYFVEQGSRPHGLQPDDIGWLRSLWDGQRTAYVTAWSLASGAERQVISRDLAIQTYPALEAVRQWLERHWTGTDIAHWSDLDVKRIDSPELYHELSATRPQGLRRAVRVFRERLMEDAAGRIAEQRRSMMMISLALLGAWGLLVASYLWSYRAFAVPVLRLAGTAARIRGTGDFSLRAAVLGRDEIGQLAEAFNGMLERLQAGARRLETAAIFQRTLLECAGVGIVTADAEGRVVSVNPAGAALLGLAGAGPVEGSVSLVDALAPEGDTADAASDRSRLEGTVSALVRERGAPTTLELTLRRPGAAGTPVQVTVSALRDSGGALLGYAAFLGDLSVQKQAQAAIRRANQELESRVTERTAELNRRVAEVESLNRDMAMMMTDLQASEEATQQYAGDLREANTQLKAALQELESFSYSVSHDLRAPLRNIGGFVDLLRRRTEASLDAESQHYVEVISGEAARLGQLIDDLLAFSRIGRAELNEERVDLAAVFEACRAERAPDTAGRRIEWRLGELPAVNADPTLMRLVIANLVDNAVKFTSRRAEAVIEFGCASGSDGSERVFFVRDNGAGFNARYSDKLFQVFQRLHSQRDFEGTGIGLANVKRIVLRHGGRVWAEGAVDKGATFYFTLPASRIF